MELEARRIGASIFLSRDGFKAICGAAEHVVPVGALEQTRNLGRRHARGERAADESAHARSGDAMDGDVMLLEPLQHADMREPLRTPAAKRDTDRRALRCVGLGFYIA